MEKQLGWAHKLGGAKSLEICKASRTVLARLIESQIWHQLASSVALLGNGLEKGQRPLLALMPDASVSSSMPVMPFKLLPQCCISQGVSLKRWVHVWAPQDELLQAPAVSSADSVTAGFCSQKLWRLIFLALERWATAPCWDFSPIFVSTCGCGTSRSTSLDTPTSLDGCGFFNSTVVRIPFNSISDGSEW